TPRCGNGVTAPGEECDDGNTADLDGCTTSCALETCGDGGEQATYPLGVTLLWTGEPCDGGATGTRFYVNGKLLAHHFADSCSCGTDPPRSMTINDPDKLELLHNGSNTFRVEHPGYSSWAVAI